jgi:hypothetical protein
LYCAIAASRESAKHLKAIHLSHHNADLTSLLTGDLDLCMPANDDDPPSFSTALLHLNADTWHVSLTSELQSLTQYHIWKLVPHSSVPKGKHVIKSKIVCHLKQDASSTIIKWKVCIVVKGFSQVTSLNYI